MKKKIIKWLLSKSIQKQDEILIELTKEVIEKRKSIANNSHKQGDELHKSWHILKEKINSI